MRRFAFVCLVVGACGGGHSEGGGSLDAALPDGAPVVRPDAARLDAARAVDASAADAASLDAPVAPDAAIVDAAGPRTDAATIGNTMPFTPLATVSGSYLLGTTVDVAAGVTVTGLGLFAGAAPGAHVMIALYDNAGGTPGHLLASTASTALAGGSQEIPIVGTPVAIAAGTYWSVVAADADVKIGQDTSGTLQTWVTTPHTYGDAFADPFPQSATAFSGGPGNLWFVVQ